MKALLVALLTLAILGAAAATIAPLLWSIEPRLIALEPMAPQFAAAAILLAVVAWFARRRGTAMIGVLAAIWNLWVMVPDAVPSIQAAVKTGDAAPLKVISYNLWYRNANAAATRDYLAASGADVIGLVEATPQLKASLGGLATLYPYSIDCIDSDPRCEIMLLSKRPLRNAFAGAIDGRYPYIARAEIDLGATPVTVVMTHLSWPFLEPPRPSLIATAIQTPQPDWPDVPRLSQFIQAANLADYLARQPADLILMGDFNSASWGQLLHRLRAASGLTESKGLRASWPSWAWPILRLSIDHVLARGRARVVATDLGPATGSDHLPVVAEIAIAP